MSSSDGETSTIRHFVNTFGRSGLAIVIATPTNRKQKVCQTNVAQTSSSLLSATRRKKHIFPFTLPLFAILIISLLIFDSIFLLLNITKQIARRVSVCNQFIVKTRSQRTEITAHYSNLSPHSSPFSLCSQMNGKQNQHLAREYILSGIRFYLFHLS